MHKGPVEWSSLAWGGMNGSMFYMAGTWALLGEIKQQIEQLHRIFMYGTKYQVRDLDLKAWGDIEGFIYIPRTDTGMNPRNEVAFIHCWIK